MLRFGSAPFLRMTISMIRANGYFPIAKAFRNSGFFCKQDRLPLFSSLNHSHLLTLMQLIKNKTNKRSQHNDSSPQSRDDSYAGKNRHPSDSMKAVLNSLVHGDAKPKRVSTRHRKKFPKLMANKRIPHKIQFISKYFIEQQMAKSKLKDQQIRKVGLWFLKIS